MMTNSLKGSGFGEVMQANRVPLTLIGIGVAWLVASNTGLADRVVNDERVQAARRRIGEFAGDIGIGGSSSGASGGQILGPDGGDVHRVRDERRRQKCGCREGKPSPSHPSRR